MHSNLASFKKPQIQFSQFQDAQTPNMPVSKQPTFIMPTFKTASVKNVSFVVSRLVVNMRTKKYCNIAKQFNMATAFLPGALVSIMPAGGPFRGLLSVNINILFFSQLSFFYFDIGCQNF
jgi:hypothetical protein